VPWHIHENEDELFYIAKGTLLMEIENQSPLFWICNLAIRDL
jgi:mannose-6-phosphate isomerase-like protein (cupin superfamily)